MSRFLVFRYLGEGRKQLMKGLTCQLAWLGLLSGIIAGGGMKIWRDELIGMFTRRAPQAKKLQHCPSMQPLVF